jgi:hypothetical protein
VIKPECAHSVLVAICDHIVTECNAVQTAALLYLCQKFYDISRSTVKKTISVYQITKSVENLCVVVTVSLIPQVNISPPPSVQTVN